jgi:hypothetical protein
MLYESGFVSLNVVHVVFWGSIDLSRGEHHNHVMMKHH